MRNPGSTLPASVSSPLLTAPQVATRLAIAVDTVYRLAHARKLPYLRVAACMRFRAEDVEAFISRGIVEPAT